MIRYVDYKQQHEDVVKAVSCILNNPSSELKEELVKIKNQIDSISISDWKDSSYVSFKMNKDMASLKLSTLITSVNNVFSKSEQTYDSLNKQLDNFKIIDDNYQGILDSEPKQSKYKKTTEVNGVMSEVNDVSAYQRAHNDWKDAKELAEIEMNNCDKKIKDFFKILDEINSLSITMSDSMPYVTSSIPSVYFPVSITYQNNSFVLANNMTLYKYNDSMYYVIETPEIDYSNIATIHGKQPDGGCLTWSNYYANDIFDNSDSVPIISSYQELLSNDKSEIMNIMASEIMAGRPSIIHVTGIHQSGERYSRHFVTVAGIKENADLNNLKESDFLIMDPTLPGLKPLDTKKSNYTTRSLLKCENATYRADSSNEGYAVLIYNDPKQYVTDTCREAQI